MSDILATKPLPEHTSLQSLSPTQARAAITLAHGGTVTAAADAAAVHRSTIYNWYENDTNFQCAVKEIFDERNRRLLDQMRELDALALVRLHRILADDDASPSIHLRAAMSVLNCPLDQHGEDAWRMPHMESLDATIHCRSDILDTPEFDAHRHIAAPPQRQAVIRHSSTELDTESAFTAQPLDTVRHDSTQIGDNPPMRRMRVNGPCRLRLGQVRNALRRTDSSPERRGILPHPCNAEQ
jgi:AcrR family transcriptional regulator